jgi:methionyl-tRNA formyltransferase
MTRAYQPWPTAYTEWRGEPLRILRARVTPGESGEPGRVMRQKGHIGVVTGDGLLLLESVQPAGKRAMDAKAFVNGAGDFVGSIL